MDRLILGHLFEGLEEQKTEISFEILYNSLKLKLSPGGIVIICIARIYGDLTTSP